MMLAAVFIFSMFLNMGIGVQSANAIQCVNNNAGGPKLTYHTDDGKCYLERNEYDYRENLTNSRCTGNSGKTGDTKTDSSGKKYCYTTSEIKDATMTYDDGSPVPYVCPAGSEPHADRNGECYKVTDTINAPRGGCPDDYEEIANGKQCKKYEKVDKVPAPEPGKDGGSDPSASFCNDQFAGNQAQIDACKKGIVEGDCKGLTGADLQACATGFAGGICDTTSSGDVSAQLRCDAAVQDCVNKFSGDTDAMRRCMEANDAISDDAIANFFKTREPGDAAGCGQAKTNLLSCDGSGVSALASVLKIALFILTIIVGIAAVGAIVYAAVLYSAGEDNSSRTSDAKNLIRNVVIGLFVYGFMVAIINWLIPGGVIG